MGRPTLLRHARAIAVLGGLAGALPSAPAAPPANEDACASAAAEARLKRKETALLGPSHANDHAKARAHQCKAAKDKGGNAARPDDEALGVARHNPASAVGAWSEPFVIPVAGVTAAVLHTGKVLFWSYDPAQYRNPNASNTGVAYLWDPATRAGQFLAPPENIWCGGQTFLNDGRLFIAGGNLRYPDPAAAAGLAGWQGALSSYTFNPANQSWTRQPDMANGRWYPTVTQLADNRAVIVSGYDETGSQAMNHAIEVFTPAAEADGVGSMSAVGFHDPSGYYPFQYLMPSGQLLQAGPGAANTVLLTPQTTAGTWALSRIPNLRSAHHNFGNGISHTDATSAPARRVVVIAGGDDGSSIVSNNEWLDASRPGAGWNAYPHWLQARHNANTVILPDGTLFTVGGNSAPGTYDSPLFHSERYNKPAGDTSGRWVRMASNTIPAAYHSSAVLLPDATVLLSEDDRNPQAAHKHRAQVYSPPYLFKGARPGIDSAPGVVSPGQSFALTADTGNIAGVALVAPGAVTHANDMHQLFVKLPFEKNGRSLRVTLPGSKSLVPPGYYMLFVVDHKGIPSIAKFVRVS